MIRVLSTLVFAWFFACPALARTPEILISVSDMNAAPAALWEREICRQVHLIGNSVSDQPMNMSCRRFSSANFLDSELSQLRPRFDYHVRIMKLTDGTISLDINNWHQTNAADFKSVEVRFVDGQPSGPSPQVTQKDGFERALYNFFIYAAHEDYFKAALLLNGLAESTTIGFNDKTRQFTDQTTREDITISRAVELFAGESSRKANYVRAGIELGVLLSAGLAIYYKNLVFNKQDFDYGVKEGFQKKLNGEAIRFDDNDKWANVGHEFAGMLYYQIGRANGANHLESFLIAFASSAAWEFLEFHEVFSINDQVMTSVGGYVLGEAFYQTSCALLAKGGTGAKIVGYTLSPGVALNHGIDHFKKGDRYAGQDDCSKPRWSEISFYLGLEKHQKPFQPQPSSKEALVGFQSEVITIPGYGKEGQGHGLLIDAALNRVVIEANKSMGLIDLRVIAQTVAGVYYQRNVKRDEQNRLQGYDFAIGLGSAITWNDRGSRTDGDRNGPDFAEDYYGTINILGPIAHATVYHKGMRIRAEFAFYGDFTMVKSYSLEPFYYSLEGPKNLPSNITKRGNYYGFGSTVLAAISLEYERFRLAYQGQMSQSASINSRSRLETSSTRRDNYEDRYQSHRFSVSYRLTRNLRLELAREYIIRAGSINGGFERKTTERRTMGYLVYLF